MFTTKRVTPGLEELFGRIFRDVENFSNGVKPEDDRTALLIRRL